MVSRGVFGLALAFALFLTGCVGLKKPTGGTNSDSMESCFAELTAELSAENMQGRGLGSDGLERAAALLETRFQAAGLTGGPQGYRQRFDAVVGVSIGQSNRLQLEEWTGKVGLDFSPLGFSSSGAFAG